MAATKISIQKINTHKNGKPCKMTVAFIHCEVCKDWIWNVFGGPFFILRAEGPDGLQHWNLGKLVDRAIQHACLAHNIRIAKQPEPESISF